MRVARVDAVIALGLLLALCVGQVGLGGMLLSATGVAKTCGAACLCDERSADDGEATNSDDPCSSETPCTPDCDDCACGAHVMLLHDADGAIEIPYVESIVRLIAPTESPRPGVWVRIYRPPWVARA